jgi:hypothetical protein
MSAVVGNQTIPNTTTTLLTGIPAINDRKYLILTNNTSTTFWFGFANTITNTSTNANALPAGKQHAIRIGADDSQSIYVYHIAGSNQRIGWAVDA